MLTSKDAALIVQHVSNDLIKREIPEIVSSMDLDSKIALVNGVKSLNEVSDHIQKEIMKDGGLVFIGS